MNPFSSANLAIVAYAEVDGVAGTSTVTNSGVSTTRLSLGLYAVVLPPYTGNTNNLVQKEARDLIFVQAKNISALKGPIPVVDDTGDATKLVSFGAGDPSMAAATYVDCSFSIIIMRTLVPPPASGTA